MHTSRAIVVGRENFGEGDCYIEFLTEEWGKVTTLAKSARKSRRRYVGGLDLFCHDEISLRSFAHGTPYLEELKVLNTFLGLREETERVFAAGRVLLWIQKLVPAATPVPEIYRLTGQILALMEKETADNRIALLELIFKIKLLTTLGLKPRVETCSGQMQAETSEPPACHAVERFLDIASGTVICGRCALGRPLFRQNALHPEERAFLTTADTLKLTLWEQAQLSPGSTHHLNKLLSQFTSFHTHVFLPQ